MRFVQGSVDEPQTKDAQGNPRLVKTGPNIGQPNPQFFVAGAVRKDDPEWPAFWNTLVTQAAADFPNLFPQGPGGACVHPQFSFKVIDGDGLDQNGKSNSDKEGFAGHWVVRFASSYPPRCFHVGRYHPHEQIQEKGAIKRGYFIRINGTVEGNGNAQRPGLYVNLDMVELAGYGPEIVSGPDASAAFGAGPTALPAGASAAPVGAPATGPGPGSGGPVAGPAAAPPPPVSSGPVRPTDPSHIHAAGTAGEQWYINGAWQPAPAGNAPAAPAAPPLPVAASPAPASPAPVAAVAPYTGYMAGPGNAPAAPALPAASPAYPAPTLSASPAMGSPTNPPAPPAAAGRVMLPAAAGATYEQMIAAGWTDDTLRQHGMMQ